MNASPDETEVIRRLFHEQVREVASGVVEIRGIVREPGNRSILAVVSRDASVDAVGACVGERGRLLKAIGAQVDGEMFDVVLWDKSAERFIANLMAPSHFVRSSFDEASRRLTVTMAGDSVPPAPDRLALRSKLVLQLTGWNLNVELPGDS